MNRHKELLRLLHGDHDPYRNFPAGEWNTKWVAWGSSHPWFQETIRLVRPRTIIEVGTFTGASAIHMAKYLEAENLEAAVICVDTFLGGIDHWTSARELLGAHFGRPSIYYEFLSNVINHKQQSRIVPFPLDSLNAARFFKHIGLSAEMVYIDGSHERGDVRRDLEMYWPLVNGGGAMLIDDITGHFPGVVQDVDEFCSGAGLKLETNAEKGILRK